MEQVLTYDNIYLNAMGYALSGKVKEASDGDPNKEKELWDTLAQTPGLKRIFRRTNPYVSFDSDHKLAKMEEGSRRAIQDREFEPLLRKYWEGGRKDNDLVPIREFISKQPWYDMERFTQAFMSYSKIANNPDRGWWLSLQGMTPEVRARMFYKKYEKVKGTEEGKKMFSTAVQFFPSSDRFWYEFHVLDDDTLIGE